MLPLLNNPGSFSLSLEVRVDTSVNGIFNESFKKAVGVHQAHSFSKTKRKT